MKRQAITVTLTAGGITLHSETRTAFNAGIKASEAVVREIARSEGQLYSGDKPERVGNVYLRRWIGGRDGRTIVAQVDQWAGAQS